MGVSSLGKQSDQCQVIALQQLGVLADITIKPGVKIGEIEVTCKPPVILEGEEDLPGLHQCSGEDECTVRVFQELCIRLPIIYKAKAKAEVAGVACGPVSWLPADGSGEECCDDCSDSSGEATSSWDDESSGYTTGTDSGQSEDLSSGSSGDE